MQIMYKVGWCCSADLLCNYNILISVPKFFAFGGNASVGVGSTLLLICSITQWILIAYCESLYYYCLSNYAGLENDKWVFGVYFPLI